MQSPNNGRKKMRKGKFLVTFREECDTNIRLDKHSLSVSANLTSNIHEMRPHLEKKTRKTNRSGRLFRIRVLPDHQLLILQ